MTNWRRNKGKQPAGLPDPATKSGPQPGDYPLGSLASRAAARVMMDTKKVKETVIQIVYVGPDGQGGWKEKNGPVIRVPMPAGPKPQ